MICSARDALVQSRHWVIPLLAVVALLLLPPREANAQDISNCTVSSTTVPFGTYNPASSTPLDNNSSTVTVTCDYSKSCNSNCNTTATVYLSRGNGTFAQRQLRSGTNTLAYNIYTSSNYSQIWADSTYSGTDYVSKVISNCSSQCNRSYSQDFTLYGRIPALQYTVVPGSYTDTLTVTVSF